MDDHEFRLYLQIDVVQLDFWIEQGWLIPEISGEKRQFRDADIARARLILDLMDDMGVNEAGVDVVMDLVDQLHGIRGTMGRLMTAISRQERDVQQRLVESLEDLERF
ncbi:MULTISPECIES: chaperone modulator CbpM [Rhizobium]|uniref:Transcriptional regulator n=1 Tax=Rhizobium sophoriradicis TaxID=1535245 RepID=A0A2A5KSZ9_9HYPH|nr:MULTISPECIES: chaperone modulator CbpM [Rhizobium]PCK80184.1 transcriptional regulator [Rhizobium sophoriradicis]UWU37117.1 chaperone modulator CbpM [Rhizobium leguminosarum bv. phaseoli]